MSEIKDGGPAFPTFEEIEHWDHDSEKFRDSIAPLGGMSLRDYFAAKALVAIIEQNGRLECYAPDPASTEAYEYADAMLRAREATK